MDQNAFINEAMLSFNFLKDRYGFSDAEVEHNGRELYIQYHRNNETISISIEPGAKPVLELFLLCADTNEQPVPWAAHNNHQRYRKLLQIDSVDNFFDVAPHILEDTEHDWLKSW